MELDELHADMVEKLTKDPGDLLESLSPKKVMLLHHVLGMATEIGELLTAVKAHIIYDKPLDADNIVEELGDFEFYASGFRATLGILREDTLKGNMEKLAKRYPGYRYTDQRALERADKATVAIKRETTFGAHPMAPSGLTVDEQNANADE